MDSLYKGAVSALERFSACQKISNFCEPAALEDVTNLRECFILRHCAYNQSFEKLCQASREQHGKAVHNTLQLLNAAGEAGELQLLSRRVVSSASMLLGSLPSRITMCAQRQGLKPATDQEPTEMKFFLKFFRANNTQAVLASLATQLVAALKSPPPPQPAAQHSTAPQQPQRSAKKRSKMRKQQQQQQQQQQQEAVTVHFQNDLWGLAAAVLELFTILTDSFKLQPLSCDYAAQSQLLPFVSLSLLLVQHAAAAQQEQSSTNSSSKSSTSSSTNNSTNSSTHNSSTNSTSRSSTDSAFRSSTDSSSAEDGAWWTAGFDKHRALNPASLTDWHSHTHLAMRVAVYMAAELDAATQYRDPDAPMPLRIPALLVQSADLQKLLLVFFALAVQQAHQQSQQSQQQQQSGLSSRNVPPDHAALLEALGVAGLAGGGSINPFVGFEPLLRRWSKSETCDPVQDLLALAALTVQFSTDHEIASVLATASWPPRPPSLPPYLPLPRLQAAALPLLLTLIEAAELSKEREHRGLLLLSLARPSGETLVCEALALGSPEPPVWAVTGSWKGAKGAVSSYSSSRGLSLGALQGMLQQQLQQRVASERSRSQPAATDNSKRQPPQKQTHSAAGGSGGPQHADGVAAVADALMLRLTPVLQAYLHSKSQPSTEAARPGMGRALIARASIQLYRPLLKDASYASAASAAFCKLPAANAAVLESCIRAASLPANHDASAPHLRRLHAYCSSVLPGKCSVLVQAAVALQDARTATDPAVGVALCGLLTSSLKFQANGDTADLIKISGQLGNAADTALVAVRALEPGFDPQSALGADPTSMQGLPSHLCRTSSSGSSNGSASTNSSNSSSNPSSRKIKDTNMTHAWLVVLGEALHTICGRMLHLLYGQHGAPRNLAAMMLGPVDWAGADPVIVYTAAVKWLGLVLRQLQLPGEPAAAASALQELQQQQAQLQRLASMSLPQLQQVKQSASAGVGKGECDSTSLGSMVREALLAGQRFAAALCSALPVPLWCNYPGCTITRRLCERDLVHSGLCAGCKMAKYCSSSCQLLHWKEGHKAACKRLQQHQQTGSAGSTGVAPNSG